MAKRMFLMLGATAVLLTALGFVKFKQVQSAVQASSFQPPPEAVTSVVAKQEVWPSTTGGDRHHGGGSGRDGQRRPSGYRGRRLISSPARQCRQGDVLVELDTRQERAQLAALEAQRDLAKINFGRMQQLVKQGVISRTEYDNASGAAESRPKRKWARSAPRLSARPSARRSREFWAFARSTWASTWPRASRSCPAAGAESYLCELRRAAAGVAPGAGGPHACA